jgi:hypothetical protein
MKINYLLAFIFIAFVSIVIVANVDEINLIGCTELNGYGCVCHTVEQDTSVSVWVEGPDSLLVGQTGIYRMFMAGGPAEAGGYNVAGRFGEMVLVDTLSFQHPLSLNELTQAFSLPFPTMQDTIYWEFGYKVLDASNQWDTIYSCGLSLVWDSIPDFHDRWNFGPKFPVKILAVTNNDDKNNQPTDFILFQNYPNPFNPSTKIRFVIPNEVRNLKDFSSQAPRNDNLLASLKIYDALGNEITTLVNEEKSPGEYEVNFDAAGLTSGLYFYRLTAGSFSETKKMLLLR